MKTIRKLQQAAARKERSQVKCHSGRGSLDQERRKAKERAAIKKAIKAGPKITCIQLKIRVLNTGTSLEEDDQHHHQRGFEEKEISVCHKAVFDQLNERKLSSELGNWLWILGQKQLISKLA